MRERTLPYQYLPVSHIGVQEMDRNNQINAKNAYSCRSCLTRLRSGKCNAVLLVVSALIVWFVIHMMNAKDAAGDFKGRKANTEERGSKFHKSQNFYDLKTTQGLEDEEHFTIESTTLTDGGGTTPALFDQYDQNNEDMAGKGSGNYGSTETPSDIVQDNTSGVEENMRQNHDEHTAKPIENVDRSADGMLNENETENDSQLEASGEGADLPTNHSVLVESLQDVLDITNDLNKLMNATGDEGPSDRNAFDKEPTEGEIKEKDIEYDSVLKRYDYINLKQKDKHLDSGSKVTNKVHPLAIPGVEATEEMREKDSLTYANEDADDNKITDKGGSDFKAVLSQKDNVGERVHFKSRDVMSVKLSDEPVHKVEINHEKDKDVIRKRRSVVHIIKAPLESMAE